MKKNKSNRLLQTGAALLLAVASTSILLTIILKWRFSIMFAVVPLFFLLLLAILAFISQKYKEKNIEIGAIIGVRMGFLLPTVILLVAGLITNRDMLLPFIIFFVVYYLIFAIIETKVLMNLTKNEIN
ncbi:MAG: hypothetical protein ACK5L7_06780 [Paludibacteraceae bacterium]